LDKEYEKFDASVERYVQLIEGLDLKGLFENYKENKNLQSQYFKNRPMTDEEIKQELLTFKILVPVLEGSEELEIVKPYKNLEELRKYLYL